MELPIAHVIPEFTSNVLLLILCFAIVCSIDIRLALSMLIAPALSIVPLSLLFKNFERDYAAYWTASERVNSTLVEYIDGIEVIKTFNQANSSYARFRNDISEFEKLTLAWYRSARIPMNAMFAIL
ncbi:MAG: ABC transporter ATP-binding protein, partial [Atopobium sp.]|nr:ABC transporter ATP-binding protein [Atopobium sp.]